MIKKFIENLSEYEDATKEYIKKYRTPDDFLSSIQQKIIIFGAGILGTILLEYLKSKNVGVKFFADNNENKQGNFVKGIPIYSPYKINTDDIVLITSGGEFEIYNQLIEMGIKNVIPCTKFTRCKLFNEIKGLDDVKDGLNTFVYNAGSNENYIISGFNSPETIYSTFIAKDWSKLEVKNRIVLDIGGYVGDTAIYFISKGAERVIVYEAFPYSCKIALRNVEINKLAGRIEIINEAVGGQDSFINIEPNYENYNISHLITSEKGVKIPIVSLKSIVETHNLKDASLKINCEGCEYDLIESADFEILRRFKYIQMHYHREPESLIKKLNKAGFKVKYDEYIYATMQ